MRIFWPKKGVNSNIFFTKTKNNSLEKFCHSTIQNNFPATVRNMKYILLPESETFWCEAVVKNYYSAIENRLGLNQLKISNRQSTIMPQ
jgi:hypothetical protein